jgi:predicted lipoprotein with Yx(FWY)xxD motif
MRATSKSVLPILVLSLGLAACGGSSNSSTSSSTPAGTPAPPASAPAAPASSAAAGATSPAAVVKTAANTSLGATVLVDAQGRTLYHLSGEGNGRFLCTGSACEAAWPPVGASAKSASIGGLGTVKRPDGSEQLAYKGEPLYTFAGDRAAGEANGRGVKADGGTWSAVTTIATAAAATKSSTSAAGGGGYGY